MGYSLRSYGQGTDFGIFVKEIMVLFELMTWGVRANVELVICKRWRSYEDNSDWREIYWDTVAANGFRWR